MLTAFVRTQYERDIRLSMTSKIVNRINRINVSIDAIPCPSTGAASKLNVQTPTAQSDQMATFRQEIATLRVAALRKKYPSEHVIHRRMLADEKVGKREVHDEFRSFKTFLQHVGPKGDTKRSLDRIDNADPEYGPGKVRWATPTEQANNRSNTTFLRGPDGNVRPLAEWSRLKKVSQNTLRSRIRYGWPEENVVSGERPTTAARTEIPTPSHEIAGEDLWPNGLPFEWQELLEDLYSFYRRRVFKSPNLKKYASRIIFASWILNRICTKAEQVCDNRMPHWKEPDFDLSQAIEVTPWFYVYLWLAPIALGATIQVPEYFKHGRGHVFSSAEWAKLTDPVRKLFNESYKQRMLLLAERHGSRLRRSDS